MRALHMRAYWTYLCQPWRLVYALMLACILIPTAGCGSGSQQPPFSAIGSGDIFMLTPDEGWVVGGSVDPHFKINAFHRHQGRWLPVLIPGIRAVTRVFALAPGDVWTVSAEGIDHYNGAHWSVSYADTPLIGQNHSLADIFMLSQTDGWAVGLNGILHFTNGAWSDASALVPDKTTVGSQSLVGMLRVAMLSPSDGWAVGLNGITRHFDGQQWRVVPNPISADPRLNGFMLDALAMVSPAQGWSAGQLIAGRQASAAILDFSNAKWKVENTYPWSGDSSLQYYINALTMTSLTDGWAAGAQIRVVPAGGLGDEQQTKGVASNFVLRYSGGQWQEVTIPDIGGISSLSFDSPEDGWAAGANGLLHYHNGTWSIVTN